MCLGYVYRARCRLNLSRRQTQAVIRDLGQILAALIVLSSCTSSETQLSEIAAHPRDYNGRLVTTCGWATNEFEDLNITIGHEGAARDGAKGLAVEWCENEPKTRGPTLQCITGTIEPAYGQSVDEADRKPGTMFAISTGSPFGWWMRQACYG